MAGEASTEARIEPRRKWSIWRRIGVGIGVIVLVLVLAVGALYAWPLSTDRLDDSRPQSLSFEQARQTGQELVTQDTGNPDVLPECRSLLRVHPQKTDKAVLMLHGYTSCPKDYVELADLFYEQGYNVFVPREPHHGLTTIATANEVGSEQLVGYADQSMDVVAGLGAETGVIGMSGGGVLATWLAEHRPDVKHLLALSPFYRPDSAQAPPLAIKPLIVLFGFHLLPDRQVGDTNFTLGGLAQYLRIGDTLDDEPVNPDLQSVAVAISAEDEYIDLDIAQEVPQRVADTNGLKLNSYEFPAELKIPHNVVGSSSLGDLGPQTWNRYLEMYEG